LTTLHYRNVTKPKTYCQNFRGKFQISGEGIPHCVEWGVKLYSLTPPPEPCLELSLCICISKKSWKTQTKRHNTAVS